MDDTDETLNLIAAANALIKKVQDEHQDIDDFYRSENLDPDKMRSLLNKTLTPEKLAQAQADFQAAMTDIEQTVAQEAARLSLPLRTGRPTHWPDISKMA